MNIPIKEKELILEKITAPASRASLLSFISWLDKACIATEDLTSIPYQILARAIVAVGYKLIDEGEKSETIEMTIGAGEIYTLHPSEQNWDRFFECATRSYPFGPGEGCFSINELEQDKRCEPGSGCTSGAGSLASLGLNDNEVMSIIAAALLPWVKGNDDLVKSPHKS